MEKVPEEKASVSKFLIFIILGIAISGHCTHLLTQYYITGDSIFYLGNMQIDGYEALFSIITFFASGLLFIVYGSFQFQRLTHANSKHLRTIAVVLLVIIILMTLYFVLLYYNFVKEDLKYASVASYTYIKTFMHV